MRRLETWAFLVSGETIDITIPVNILTHSVRVDLLEPVDGSTGRADRGFADIPNGSTSVIVPVYVNNGGFAPGRYDVGVQLGRLPTIEAQLLMTTYARISTTSPTDDAWKKEDFIAGSNTTVGTSFPIQFIQPNPP